MLASLATAILVEVGVTTPPFLDWYRAT